MLYSYQTDDSLSNETKHDVLTPIFNKVTSLTHKLPLHVKAPLTSTRTVGGFLRDSILSFRELRKRSEMVTISFLTLLLPANQGKHFPRSKLQGTVPPGLSTIGAGVCVGGFRYLPSGTILTAPGPPGKLPKVF